MTLVEADLTDFTLRRKDFRLAVCTSNTLMHLTTPHEQMAAATQCAPTSGRRRMAVHRSVQSGCGATGGSQQRHGTGRRMGGRERGVHVVKWSVRTVDFAEQLQDTLFIYEETGGDGIVRRTLLSLHAALPVAQRSRAHVAQACGFDRGSRVGRLRRRALCSGERAPHSAWRRKRERERERCRTTQVPTWIWHSRRSAPTVAFLPRLEATFADAVWPRADGSCFVARLDAHFPDLFRLLVGLYGGRYDFFFHLQRILELAAESWLDRPDDLKQLDAEREDAAATGSSPQEMLGGVCYVDLFAGDLQGIEDKIPYFRELGLTYLHLMPLFAIARRETTTAATRSAIIGR